MANDSIEFGAFEDLTRLIYGAVFDQSRWGAFLDELTRVTGGVHTHLFGYDIPAGISLGLTAAGYAPDYLRSYEEHYAALNAWAPRFSTAAPGTIVASEWMCPYADLCRTEFYNDWIRPQEDIAAGGGSILFKNEVRMLVFGGNIRLKDAERLEGRWFNTVGLLTPHLQQAFEIARIVAGQSLELDLLRNGQAAGRAAVLLLAENGFVLHANATGERMLIEGRVMGVDHAGRMRFFERQAALKLGACLAALRRNAPAAASFPASCLSSDSHMTVRAARFDPDMHEVQPFPLLFGYSRPCLLVTVSDPQRRKEARQAAMSQYGLTAAEADIAVGIADGHTVSELAEQRAVSIHTARNQLKSAMSKMYARRQADLVRMIEAIRGRQPL